MNVTNSTVTPHTGPVLPSTATNVAPAVRSSLPQAPEGLGNRKTGPTSADSAHGRGRAQLPSTPPLVPYPSGHLVRGSTKTLVAITGEVSKEMDAQLTARRIVLDAEQSRLAKELARDGKAAPGSALEKFVSGTLDHVYVDAKNFKALARGSGPVDGRPEQFPVYVDTKSNQLVVDIEHAFVPGDELSPAARRGLAEALKIGRKVGPQEPRYEGRAVSSTTKGGDFYKPNNHPYLHGDRVNATAFTHPHYFEAENTKALGKEVVVHRGLIDNRNGIPENSLAAIDSTYRKGFRSLELDIQVTADGVPVLLHDFTIGRMTDDPANRLVSHVKWDELKHKELVIRNPVDGNFVKTEQKVASVRDALLDIARNKPDMSIALDCKEQTAEAAFDILRKQPELRRFTALKLYAKAYAGGFDQFVGNLYARYGIDPQSVADKPRRQELLDTLKEIKVVPVFSEGVLKSDELQQLFPAKTPKAQGSAEGLAETAMAWLQGWRAMDVKVIEAVPSGTDTPEGKAMAILNQRLAQEDSGLSKAATSAAYRYEDFSVPQKDDSKKFYTWQIFGGITDVTDNPTSAKTETAGTLRHVGANVLTDQPEEEVYATAHNRTLPRGHTGMELDVPPGTPIDTARNEEVIQQRTKQFLAEKQHVDLDRVAAVRAGRDGDKAVPAEHEAAGLSDNPWVAGAAAALGVAAAAYAGVKAAPRVLRAGRAGHEGG